MNLTHFHHTCMAGGKIYNSSRILHALLKKSYKTGGCLLKSSDQDHRIRVGAYGVGVGGLNSGLNFSIKSSEPHPLGKIHNPGPARMARAMAMAADAGWRRQPRVLVASVAMPSAAAVTTCALSTNSSHVPGIAFVLISAIDFAEVAAKISRLTRRSNRKSRRLQ